LDLRSFGCSVEDLGAVWTLQALQVLKANLLELALRHLIEWGGINQFAKLKRVELWVYSTLPVLENVRKEFEKCTDLRENMDLESEISVTDDPCRCCLTMTLVKRNDPEATQLKEWMVECERNSELEGSPIEMELITKDIPKPAASEPLAQLASPKPRAIRLKLPASEALLQQFHLKLTDSVWKQLTRHDFFLDPEILDLFVEVDVSSLTNLQQVRDITKYLTANPRPPHSVEGLSLERILIRFEEGILGLGLEGLQIAKRMLEAHPNLAEFIISIGNGRLHLLRNPPSCPRPQSSH
jgi:hypothetical protein